MNNINFPCKQFLYLKEECYTIVNAQGGTSEPHAFLSGSFANTTEGSEWGQLWGAPPETQGSRSSVSTVNWFTVSTEISTTLGKKELISHY